MEMCNEKCIVASPKLNFPILPKRLRAINSSRIEFQVDSWTWNHHNRRDGCHNSINRFSFNRRSIKKTIRITCWGERAREKEMWLKAIIVFTTHTMMHRHGNTQPSVERSYAYSPFLFALLLCTEYFLMKIWQRTRRRSHVLDWTCVFSKMARLLFV